MSSGKAQYYIDKLGLTIHPEGGAFKETYRSDLIVPKHALPGAFQGSRNASTTIYFLLEEGQFSAFHQIASDEGWHFYDGEPLTVYEIRLDGKLIIHKLGRNLEAGETFQCMIKAGSWFGSRCEIENGFSLVGCTVAPGFDFVDFSLADRKELTRQFSQHAVLIESLTS
jgi:predicted cupin superfamily sugar epimerase